MRSVAMAIVMAAAVQTAQAADMPDFSDLPILRGAIRERPSAGVKNWNGYYGGGQAAYVAPSVDFSNASASQTSFMLRNAVLQGPVSSLQVFGKNDFQSTSFGGFVGRNYQWDDVVIGVEANYNHMSKTFTSQSNSLSRTFTNPAGEVIPANHQYDHRVTVSGNASMEIQDVMTFRTRAAWATGNFLPYAFGGLAVARVASSRNTTYNETLVDTYTDTSTVPTTVTQTNTVYAPLTSGQSRSNNFIAGYTMGLGTEIMLFGNLFVRGEWEYIRFANQMDIKASMNTGRVGVGYKF